MKIGIYLGDIKKPNSIGDLTFELSIVEELQAQKTNHEFVFYYFGKKNIFKNTKNTKFVCLKYFKKPQISTNPFKINFTKIPIFSLNYRILKDNVNLMWFLTPYLHEYIEIPYFATIRDVSHRVLPHFPEFSTKSFFEKKEKRLNSFLTKASKIITCNKNAKSDIKTLYDVIDDNIEIMPLPYPNWLKNIKEDENILRKNSLVNKGYILYPAQFWTHKNHIRLILASQLMNEQNINLKVVFTGLDRGNEKYLKQQVKNHDLEEDVLFLDYVNQEELTALYKNAYALVYPSLAGLDSVCALEAMYFNCPVIISNHAGYMQQLNKSALYFNPLDEIDIVEKIKMLNDISIKDEIISKGELLIRENTCKNYTDRILKITDNFYLTRQCWSLTESYEHK